MRVFTQSSKSIQYIKHGLSTHEVNAGPSCKPQQPLKKEDKKEFAEVNRALVAIKRASPWLTF